MAETGVVTKEEKVLLEFLDAIDGETEAAKSRAGKYWDENGKLLKGEGAWKGARNPLFLINLIGNQYERKIGLITEAKPTFTVVSRVGEYGAMSKVLTSTCMAKLEEEEFPLTLERVARFAMAFGCGFVQTTFDKDRDDISINCLDPRSVYIDPSVTEAAKLGKQAHYLRVDHVVPVTSVRVAYPGRGALVEADDRYSRYAKNDTRRGGAISAVLNFLPRVWKPGEESQEGPIERTLVKEYWLRDPDVGSFPGGRHIIRAGDVILRDEQNKNWDQEFDIDMLDWRMDLDGPWGLDEIQELKKLQEAMNRLGDAIMRNALYNSQGWVVADSDALDATQWKSITNEGGLIVKKRPMREFRRESAPQLPAYLFQMLQAIPSMADLVTGNAESLRAKPKGGMDSIVDGLQMTGSIMARIIARRFESLVSRIGQRLISRIIQHFNGDRMLNYYSVSGELVNYMFERQRFRQDDNGISLKADDLPRLYRQFRFLVQPYSSLQTTKTQRTQIALGLHQASGGRAFPMRRVIQMADIGDPDVLMAEARAEQESGLVPPPLPPVKR